MSKIEQKIAQKYCNNSSKLTQKCPLDAMNQDNNPSGINNCTKKIFVSKFSSKTT